MELKSNKIELCKAVKLLEFFSLLIVVVFLISCERDTTLSIEGGLRPLL